MKPNLIGASFKPVVIDSRLRDLVNSILLASSSSASSVLVAKKRIRAVIKPATTYLFATQMQSYLDSKTLGGNETRVYPLVGDLFLDALEVNLSSLGPNFFRDHYSGIAWCYGHGQCPGKAVQGAFYCVDLALRKTLELFLAKDAGGKGPKGVSLSFQSDTDLDYRSMITSFLDMGRQCLRDAVRSSTRSGDTKFTGTFMDFVIDRKNRLESVLSRWEVYHRRRELPDVPNEQYLEGVAETADKADYAPLAAMAKEYQVVQREQNGLLIDGKSELTQGVHPLFNAASQYLSQGTEERDGEAYDLALRRYGKAAALFSKIHDRTSTAKAYVERARVFIKSGEDSEVLRENLHVAIGLIMACIQSFPKGTLPEVTDEQAVEFLRKKGYFVEAEAYARSLI